MYFNYNTKGLNARFSPFFIFILILLLISSTSCRKNAVNTEKDLIVLEEQNNDFVYNKCKKSVLKLYAIKDKEVKKVSSAVVIKNKLILTAYHAINDDMDEFHLETYDGVFMACKVLSYDIQEDLALLKVTDKVKRDLLNEITLASESAQIGQKCISLSFPLDDIFLSTGVVGGKVRIKRDKLGNLVSGMIANSSWTLSGSSGGALLNKNGELIGLNYAVHSDRNSINVSFAYDIALLKPMINKLIFGPKNGNIETQKASLDVTFLPLVDKAKLSYSNPPSNGVIVSNVLLGGNCDGKLLGGEKKYEGQVDSDYEPMIRGDIIVKIAGYDICTFDDIWTSLADKNPGDKVEIVIYRDKKFKTIEIELSKRLEGFEKQFIRIKT